MTFADAAAQAEIERGTVPLSVQIEVVRHITRRGEFSTLPDLRQHVRSQLEADALTVACWNIERGGDHG